MLAQRLEDSIFSSVVTLIMEIVASFDGSLNWLIYRLKPHHVRPLHNEAYVEATTREVILNTVAQHKNAGDANKYMDNQNVPRAFLKDLQRVIEKIRVARNLSP